MVFTHSSSRIFFSGKPNGQCSTFCICTSRIRPRYTGVAAAAASAPEIQHACVPARGCSAQCVTQTPIAFDFVSVLSHPSL